MKLLTRLFRTRRTKSTLETQRADLQTRERVRQQHPISNACRVNGLTRSEQRQVFRHFEAIAADAGMAEARQQAVDLAAAIARKRRPVDGDPWQPSAA